MTKLILVLVFSIALLVPAAAVAAPEVPSVVCANCDPSGTGWSGCTQLTADHSTGLPYVSWVRHYLVVSYCKRYGTITTISISAHGCDVKGVAFCHPGAAWQTGGGVGYGYATFEAHATWGVTLVPFYNSSDTLTLTVPVG